MTDTLPLLDAFSKLDDPRSGNATRHLLSDILTIAVCAITAGAQAWTEVERFGQAKRAWFEGFLALPGGIPSHDTFGRLFAALDPEAFREAFRKWTASVSRHTDGEVIALDGKTLRGSANPATAAPALHLVTAWAATNRLVLAQLPTASHSNEITALPRLLRLLYLNGCIVTIDAAGCQRAIARQIRQQQGHYVLALKSNHPTLHQDVVSYFQEALGTSAPPGLGYAEATDGGHGRVEVRRCWVTDDVAWLERAEQWAGLRTLAMIEAERHVGDQVSQQRRYFLSSLEAEAERLLAVVRTHWEIENKQHWVLDVVYGEDQSQVRVGHGAENLATLRRLTLNLLRQDTTKDSLKGKRQRAGWDNEYLARLLNIQMR